MGIVENFINKKLKINISYCKIKIVRKKEDSDNTSLYCSNQQLAGINIQIIGF